MAVARESHGVPDSVGRRRPDIPLDIWQVQTISYWIVLPLVIIIGLIVSSLSAIVLSRAKLRLTHVNTYFLLLALADLFIFLVSIPTVRTLNGCNLYTYNYALYFVHVVFTLFYIIQTFSLYLILWISYDRFLAIWDFKRFHQIQKPKVMRVRLVCTLIMCILIHMEHMFTVEITCSTAKNYINGTLDCHQDNGNLPFPRRDPLCGATKHQKDFDYSCDNGVWIINDGLYHVKHKPVVLQVFWVIRGMIVSAIPILLVVFLNLGIVGGILHQRHRSTTSTTRTQRRDLSRIYIILAISATFVCCTAPVLLHAFFYAQNIDNCHGPYSEEIFRSVANLLLLVEHITHFVILCFNDIFSGELKRILLVSYQYLRRTCQKLPTVKSASKPDCNKDKPSTEAARIEPLSSIMPPVITIEMDNQQPNKDTSGEQVPDQDLIQTRNPHTPDSLSLPRRSPTASLATIEDFL